MKRSGKVFLGWVALAAVWGLLGAPVLQAAENSSPKSGKTASGNDLAALKAEWESVRDQQVQMIREKEDQLEKLKEEIFAKMKNQSGGANLDAQKAAFQTERQKFASEMNRQKESLRQLQAELDRKTKQLEEERARFEQEKKEAVR